MTRFNMDVINDSITFDKHLLALSLEETGEPFVSLQMLCQKNHVHMVFSGGKKNLYWLRLSVASALLKAAQRLYAQGYLLVLEDAYRSLSVQKKKFIHEVTQVKKNYPGVSVNKARKMANTFVAGIPILAAHTAGAAVDLTICTLRGKPVDMGCPYLSFSEKTITQCPIVSKEAKKNRKILVTAMESAGFSNYPFEYWHFSMGDVCDAYLKHDKKAVYGPVELDRNTGTGESIFTKKECYAFFQ